MTITKPPKYPYITYHTEKSENLTKNLEIVKAFEKCLDYHNDAVKYTESTEFGPKLIDYLKKDCPNKLEEVFQKFQAEYEEKFKYDVSYKLEAISNGTDLYS